MSRRKNLIPSRKLTVMIPEDLFAKLTLHLYSESAQRVPLGSYQGFFVERIQEYFSNREAPANDS
jgi:hypothetical protein